MPNWCSTRIAFTGAPEKINVLHDFIADKKANDEVGIKNDFGSFWLGNYLERVGIDFNEYRCRGHICYVGGVYDFGQTFVIDTDTAWAPMLKMWKVIIDKIAPGVEIEFSCEEPGCGVYVSNDPAMSNQYHVDLFDEEYAGDAVVEVFGESHDESEDELRFNLLKLFSDAEDLSTDALVKKLEKSTGGISIAKWQIVPIEEMD